MNYNSFLNEQVVNKNKEVGVIISTDKEHIVVKYASNEKTYNPEVAFRTGFLVFKNKDLKQKIDQDLLEKDIALKKQEEELKEARKKYLEFRKKVNKTYKRLYVKNRVLLALFGRDFVYPPIKEFEKKYKHLIDKNLLISNALCGQYERLWNHYN